MITSGVHPTMKYIRIHILYLYIMMQIYCTMNILMPGYKYPKMIIKMKMKYFQKFILIQLPIYLH